MRIREREGIGVVVVKRTEIRASGFVSLLLYMNS